MNDGGAVIGRGEGRILDRGYQHYEGRRYGVPWAMRAVILGTVQRSLGFRRPTSAKIFPLFLLLGCFAPALIVLGVRLLVGGQAFARRSVPVDQVVPLWRYFDLIATLVMVLTALAASEALCPDRRQRVLPLYYASLLTPRLYLAARVAGVVLVLCVATILPPLLLWTGNVLLADDPWSYLAGHIGQFWAILGAGFALALFDAAIGCAVAGFSERKAYAAGALLGGVIALTTVAETTWRSVHADWSRYALLFAPLRVPVGVGNWLFGHTTPAAVAGAWYLAALVVVTILALAIIERAYAAVRF